MKASFTQSDIRSLHAYWQRICNGDPLTLLTAEGLALAMGFDPDCGICEALVDYDEKLNRKEEKLAYAEWLTRDVVKFDEAEFLAEVQRKRAQGE